MEKSEMDTKYHKLNFNQPNLIGDVIAGIHSGCDLMLWEGRRDLIVYGSAQFGSGMWYLREDGLWRGERVFTTTQLTDLYGYPKLFDWNGDGVPDLITLKQGLHLWENIGGTPIPQFRYAGILKIEEDSLRKLPGSITQIDFVRLSDGWAALIGCDDWSSYWPSSMSPWDNHEIPTLGLGKSYDADGKWKGGELYGSVWMLHLRHDGSDLCLTHAQKLMTVESKPLDVYGTAAPAVVDLDRNGNWSLILGDFGDTLTYFHNVGSRDEPIFMPGVKLHTPNGSLRLYHNLSRPRAVDWQGKGAVDLLIGQENGRIYLTRFQELCADGVPLYTEATPIQQRDPELSVGSAAVPVLCDWDGDGDLDLIVGDTGGDVSLFENVGTSSDPKFALPVKLQAGGQPIRIQAGATGSIQGPAEAKYGYTCPTVADWNGNGLPDLIISDVTGRHTIFLNVGTRTDPRLAEGQPILLDGQPLQTVWRVRPWAIDWDGDGLIEYLTLDDKGILTVYKRVPEEGETDVKKWLSLCYEDGSPIKLDGPAGHEGRTKLHVTDWNDNGKWDILFGIKGNQPLSGGVNEAFLFLLENVGTNANPCFRRPQALCDANGNRLKFGGHSATPNVGTLYGNDRPILLVGAEDGRIYWHFVDVVVIAGVNGLRIDSTLSSVG